MTVGSIVVATSGSTGNGATVAFSFSFSITAYGAVTAAQQIQVLKETIATGARSILTLDTDYTVAINGDQASSPGGIATLTTAPSSAYKIWIRLNPSFLQATDLAANSAFNAQTIEDQLDQMARQILILKDQLRRAPVLDTPAGASFSGEITGPFTANYGLTINGAGTGWTLSASTSGTISATMAAFCNAGSIAAARAALSLDTANTPSFAGLTLTGRLIHSVGNVVYDLAGASAGVMANYSYGSTVSIAASKNLNVLYWEDTLQPANAAIAHFINCNLTINSSAHSAANVRGYVANLINQGPATAKAMYGRAEGTGSSSGALASHTGQIVPGASTSAAYGMQLAGDSTARKVDYAYQFQAVSGAVSLDYGVKFFDGVAIGQSALEANADGVGNLWSLLNAAGSAYLAYCSATGQIESAAAIRSKGATHGVGYATGAGGTATQTTNRSAGVQVDKVCGAITTDTTSLAAEASATFTVTNSAVAITDTVVVSIRSGSNGGNTSVSVKSVAAGSFNIMVSNNNAAAGAAETGAIVINFAVLKAVSS